MKAFKFLIGTVAVLALIAFGVYHFGTKFIADEVMGQVAAELETSGQLDNLKKEIQNNPELRTFIEEGKNADSSKLPFKTKEEATRVLLKKFDLAEINDIQVKVRQGMSASEQQELLTKIQSKLTEEEMLALKALAYKELFK
ncbi:hypothetical protein QTL97_06445 [Sporosarcina thermotolerans]|uniref:Phenylalanyl-tRNA synthetase subunit beta n=1 Tax=Sporosarcina thermotolerans TaxID=633404 RepID=A0AAW9A5T2_9BACL|nr:hypothetical protein [Sporosarcina thermotolerans]MDW0116567.1 hypothetical protein [Sporosarcina thermotolerans]WHT48789.1 hypothetical protein QNH10_03320 [Sporosarcina thermotolerans]